jgi:hypothetical protein
MDIDCKEACFFGILFFCWVWDRQYRSGFRRGVLVSKSEIDASDKDGDEGGEDPTDERED